MMDTLRIATRGGLAPGNSFQLADIDYINLGNGALSLRIPLFDRKGRGVDSGAFVTYNSKIWTAMPFWDGILPHTLDQVRWTFSNETGNDKWVHFGLVNSGILPTTRMETLASSIMLNIAISLTTASNTSSQTGLPTSSPTATSLAPRQALLVVLRELETSTSDILTMGDLNSIRPHTPIQSTTKMDTCPVWTQTEISLTAMATR